MNENKLTPGQAKEIERRFMRALPHPGFLPPEAREKVAGFLGLLKTVLDEMTKKPQ